MSALAYRRAGEQDLVFVLDSWLDSYRTAHAAGLIAMEDWRVVMGPQIRKLLQRPGAEVIVAYKPKEASGRADLYGWIAVEGGLAEPHVHYCYVKQPYRRMGIARGLMASAGIEPEGRFRYSCKTGVVSALKPKIPRARWAPLVARFPKNDPCETE